jgi:hypothetical protein
MRRFVIAASVGALAVGGTAIAAPGDGPLGLLGGDPEERRAEFARDLASKLEGVNANEVERALEQVQQERRAEHRAELARDLAAQLEGVSAEEAEQALDKAQEQLRQSRGEDFRPRDNFIETLARELDKSEDQIEKALADARRARLDQKLDEAVKEGRISEGRANGIRERIEEGPPFGRGRFGRRGGFGPGGHFGGHFGGPPPDLEGPPPG